MTTGEFPGWRDSDNGDGQNANPGMSPQEWSDAQQYFDIVEGLIVALNMQGQITLINRKGREILGYEAGDLPGKNWFETCVPESISQEVWGVFQQLMAGQVEPVEYYENPVLTKSGEERLIAWHNTLLTDESGRIIGTLASGEDITERKQAEEEIRKLSQAIEHSPNIVFITNANGEIEYANPKFTALTGYSAEETIGRLPRILDPDKITGEEYEERWRAIRSGDEWRGEFHNRKKNGQHYWEFVSISSIRDEYGSIAHFVIVEEDITERKQAENLQHIQRDLGIALSSTSDMAEALNQLLEAAFQLGGVDSGGVYLVDRSTGGLDLAVHQGLPRQFVESAAHFDVDTPQHQLVMAGEPIYSRYSDIAPDNVDEIRQREGLRASAVIPIQYEGQVIAALNLASHTSDEFPANTRREIEAVVAQIGEAITRIKAESALRQLNVALQQRHEKLAALQTIGQALSATLDGREIGQIVFREVVQKLLGASNFTIAIFDEETQTIQCSYAVVDGEEADLALFPPMPLGEGPASATIRTREPRIIDLEKALRQTEPKMRFIQVGDDERLTRSSLYVPLISGDKVIGVMNVQHYDKDAFSEVDLVFMSTLANQAAIAIANAQLYESEREQRLMAEALRDIASSFSGALDTEVVMNRILANLGRVVPHDTANIMLITDNDTARIAYTPGYPTGFETFRRMDELSLDTPPLYQMLTTGEPCLIPDTKSESRWDNLPGTEWVHSYIGVPIRARGNVIGFLNLNSATPDFFTTEHTERLQAFADQAAITIENAQLYDTLVSSTEEVTALYQATAFLSTSLLESDNLTDLGQQIAEMVVNEFNIMDCGVILKDADSEVLKRLARAGEYRVDAVRPLTIDGPGLVPQALRAGEVVYAPNVAENPHYLANEPRTRSELVIPLQTNTGIIGALDLQSAELDAFSERDQYMLDAFAERAAAALENMQLYEEIRRHATELEARVIERTKELDRERAQLRAILDAMGDGVLYIEGTETRYVNPALAQMTGYSAEELLALPLSKLRKDNLDTLQLIGESREFTENYMIWQEEAHLWRKDGSTFDVALTMTRPEKTSTVSFREVTLVRDISQEKALQEQKDRFIASAAHELRTPLTVIKLRIHVLRRQPKKLKQHLEVLDHEMARMARLVDGLLDISRFERGIISLEREQVVLQNIVTDVVTAQQPRADQKAITLLSNMPDAPLNAFVDPTRITQVVTNFVVNALNYTPEGGRVAVQLTTDQASDSQHTIIRVQDTGIGIPPEHLDSIFEPFFRIKESKAPGSGLGLSITKEIVEAHDGQILVESEVGQGSTFTVILPFSGAD